MLSANAAEPLFSEDFSKTEPGKLPEPLLRLDGDFVVKEEAGNRFLELPGSPLDSFGVMFGPGRKENWGAQARILGTAQGRRFPVFGVSINTVGGYRVQVAPAKKLIELLKGDDTVATASFTWESGSWTQVRVQIRKSTDGKWRVEGKAWKDGSPEPAAWGISWEESEVPVTGRAAVWGQPFSGTPLRFDDLKVVAASE